VIAPTAATELPRPPDRQDVWQQHARRQSVPHGGLHRAPILRQPDAQLALRERFPPRPTETGWPATGVAVEDLLAALTRDRFHTADPQQRRVRRRGVAAVVAWLGDERGDTWQQRWQSSGAQDVIGNGWIAVPLAWHAANGRSSRSIKELIQVGVQVLTCRDVIRPDLGWMLGRRSGFLRPAMAAMRDPDGFARLETLCAARSLPPATANAVIYQIALLLAAKGGAVADVTVGDCVQLCDLRNSHGAVLYELLHAAGVFPVNAPATIRVFGRAAGQLSIAELVDRRDIACRPARDLLVDYLTERQPGLDYASLADYAYILAGVFWRDLEIHHPGIESLHLPAEVAAGWKQRVQTTLRRQRGADGNLVEVQVPRREHQGVLIKVRGFYLDIAQWAVEDPSRWAAWSAPCPIRAAEVERTKHRRRHKAHMDQRTRDQIPVLPRLVAAVERRRGAAAERLAVARTVAPGATFAYADQTLRRAVRPSAGGTKVWAEDLDTGQRHDLTREEDDAFWTWAIIEVLRHTGIRIEELLELTHHAIVQYRLPTTGELVPLLQITPSKTDLERLLLVSPELADVLAAIVARVRGADGAVRLIASYDSLEKTWRPPLPLLLQHRIADEDRPINRNLVTRLLTSALAELDPEGDPTRAPEGELAASAGESIRFRPHDFRRIFVTEAILNGLPPHIAQIVCGHRDIATTLGYKAIYPTEAIEAHRAFLARRRALRPAEEYRTPTDAEWQEFLGHFERRKVSVGTCGRAYATACQHEHACIRCPMLRPDLAHKPRLIEIRDNLTVRIAEAEREGWLGELEGLTVSYSAAEQKLAQLDSAAQRRMVALGMPRITDAAGRVVGPADSGRPG
jgi:Phage integrase family